MRTVDVISGGFPCQPFSVAGNRRGKEDDRYLWPEMLRVIQEIRPAWCIGENVAGIVNMALDTVLSDLENLGYSVQAFIIPACGVDAPHKRERCAIVANDNRRGRGENGERESVERIRRNGENDGLSVKKLGSEHRGQGRSTDTLENADSVRRSEQGVLPQQQGRTEFERHGEAVADADNGSRIVRGSGKLSPTESAGKMWRNNGRRAPEHGGGKWRPAKPGLDGMVYGFSDWLDEPAIPRIASGIPDRVDRLKCLGNAVVPAQFYPIFQAIADIENGIGGDNNEM